MFSMIILQIPKNLSLEHFVVAHDFSAVQRQNGENFVK